MKAILGCTLALLLAAGASPAAAQRGGIDAEIEAAVERSGMIPAIEALAAATGPELERLATSMEALVRRVADDPALRRSAVQVAVGAVQVAEIVVVEHTDLLRDALRDAAARLEEMADGMRALPARR